MSEQCDHSSRVDVTAWGDRRYQYICILCGVNFQGDPVPSVPPIDELRRVIPHVVTLGCGVAGVMPDFPEIPLAAAVDTLHDIAKKIEEIG